MVWTIEFEKAALKDLKNLDSQVSKRILQFMDDRVIENPYRLAVGLKGNLTGLFRYRVGDYRIQCYIQEEKLIVLVISIAHRRESYS